MDPERWKRIDEIFHAALERNPSERAIFLADACKEDSSLLAELKALISTHEKESGFFETPPSDLAAAIVDSQRSFITESSQYKILKKIGSGGMGQVYLADDTRLHRKVALKLLPLEFTNNKERIRRFEREARTVIALNHPNIITVYDYGQINSSSFIVTEFIDGETLRQKISKLLPKEILGIVIQVAEALDAAHTAGIIHRDIKPENIMVRMDGYVKVLDFGLSKSMESVRNSEESEIEAMSKTEAGLVIGTVRYMSPEQARGLNLDARTDLFSLGVVLYEMIAGRNPFDGPTPQDVLVAILEKNPSTINLNDKFPQELQSIVTKALAKDPNERYQTAKEFIVDLKQIQKQLESETEFKTSSNASITAPVIRLKRKAATIVVGSLALAALLALVVMLPINKKVVKSQPQHFSKTKITRLTSSGMVYEGVISPDGKYAAYVQEDASGQQSLYLKQLAVNTEIKILTLPSKTFFHKPRQFMATLTFSTDGEYIYYLISMDQNDTQSLNRIPVLGGIGQKLIDNVDFAPTFSPDGKRIAFPRTVKDEEWIIIAQADGSDQRKIAAHKSPPDYYEDIEWSPDGKILAVINVSETSEQHRKKILGINLNDLSTRDLFHIELASDIYPDDLEWVSDGSGMILTKVVDGKKQIYHFSYPAGELTSVTNDFNEYRNVSITKDNRLLLATQRVANFTIWTALSDHPDNMTQLTSGSLIEDGSRGISWTPDGKIIYESIDPTNEVQLWMMNPDGTEQKRITTGKALKRFPSCSPDGRYIVYTSEDGNLSKIMRMDSDGANVRLLSANRLARWPRISPDSKSVVYSTFDEKEQELIKVQIDGTQATKLSSHLNLNGAVFSPDGTQIAYSYTDLEKSLDLFVDIIPSNGGVAIKTFKLNRNVFPYGRIQWTPDGRGLAFIEMNGHVWNVRILSVKDFSIHPMTNQTTNQITNFSWSLDGKQIAYSRGIRTSDIVLIQDMR